MKEIDLSLSIPCRITCQYCKQSVETSYCIIIDIEKSPHLIKRAASGDIHVEPCPSCYKPNTLRVTLLFLNRNQTPHLFFSPALYNDTKRNENDKEFLGYHLKKHAGVQWREAWVKDLVYDIEHQFLPYIFKPFIKPAKGEAIAALQIVLFRLLQVDNDLKLKFIQSFPELISSEVADRALKKMIRHAEKKSDEDMAACFRANQYNLYVMRIANSSLKKSEDSSIQVSEELLEIIDRTYAVFDAGDRLQAIKLARQALEICKVDENVQLFAHLSCSLAEWLDQGKAQSRARDVDLALHYLTEAFALCSPRVTPQNFCDVINMLGHFYVIRINGKLAENIERSIGYLKKVQYVDSTRVDAETVAMIQHNLGNAYHKRIKGEHAQNIEQAIKYFSRAQKHRTMVEPSAKWAGTEDALGVVYTTRIRGRRADNIERAIEHFNNAIDVHRRINQNDDLATALNNLATAYGRRIVGDRAENIELAIKCGENALQVCTPNYSSEEKAKILVNMGVAYFDRLYRIRPENIEKAIELYSNALELVKGMRNPLFKAKIQMNLGNAYGIRVHDRNHIETAIKFYGEALKGLVNESGSRQLVALINSNLAGALVKRSKGRAMTNYEKAIHHCDLALKVFTRKSFPSRWATTNHILGIAHWQLAKDNKPFAPENAINCLKSALRVHRSDRFPHECRRLLNDLADIYFEREEWKLACKAFKEAIKVGENLLIDSYSYTGRQYQAGQNSMIYSQLAYCFARLGKFDEALITLDQGKTRVLAEALTVGATELNSLPASLLAKLEKTLKNVNDIEIEHQLPTDTPERRSDQELASLLHEKHLALNKVKDRIRRQYPEIFPVGLSVSEFMDLIPSGGAIVAPIVTSRGSMVFILQHGCKRLTTQNILWLDRFNFNDLMTMMRTKIRQGNTSGWLVEYVKFIEASSSEKIAFWRNWCETIEHTCRTLWKKLLNPVCEALQHAGLAEGSPLVLMPQGGLGLLPLHAAFREVGGKRRYLLDEFAVSYAASGRTLRNSTSRLMKRLSQTRSILGVINPTADLTYATSEWKSIAKLFHKRETTSLSGQEAITINVEKEIPKRSYLHFACHGFYDWIDPLKSGLNLANGQVLSLADITTKLNLNGARLVVLSACETGITDVVTSPDEYIGLPSAMMQAGATSVVGTLWAVDDLSTMLLMEKFYHHHIEDELPPALALRLAQLWLASLKIEEIRRRFPKYRSKNAIPFKHPFYWAAFMIIGQ